MTSSSWKVRVRKCFCRTLAAIAYVIPLQPGCAKPVRISSSCKISLGIRISRLPWTFMLMWRRSWVKKSWAIWKLISQSKRDNVFIKDREVLLIQESLPFSVFIPIFCRIYWKMSLSVLQYFILLNEQYMSTPTHQKVRHPPVRYEKWWRLIVLREKATWRY